MTNDSELLRIEIETLWTQDERGRLADARRPDGEPAPYLVIAVAPDGVTLTAIGRDVPDDLADMLLAAIEDAPARGDASSPPDAIRRCEPLIRGALGEVELTGGPSYLIPPGTRFETPVAIRRSAAEPGDGLVRHRPGNWDAEEWQALLGGALGPWAIATVGEQPVSICHSARLAEHGAEAGVWTAPEYRGRGYAAAVTAAWASLLEPSDRHLFYSTSADNLSSQRVAARLGLRLIGWIWRLSRPQSP